MKLYYMEMDVVKSWNEIIKSYSFQVWPKFEEWKFEVFSQDFWLEFLLQVWWWLKKTNICVSNCHFISVNFGNIFLCHLFLRQID